MDKAQRLAAAAFFTDFALYLLMLSLPFRVLALEGQALQLGLVPVLYAAPYSLVAATAGHFSDRWPRRGPIRFGLTLAVLGGIGLALADSLTWIFASIPLVGIGLGFFWPSLQAGFSEVHEGRDLQRMVGIFNVSWSAGKGSGMLLGGVILDAAGATVVSGLAAAAFATAALVLPWMQRPGDHQAVIAADERRPPLPVQRAFVNSAWIVNGIGFGVVATLNHHFPPIALENGLSSRSFGIFLGAVFLCQTLFFVLVGPRRGWHYRIGWFLAAQAVVAAVVLLTPRVTTMALLLPLAALLGATLGFAYQSSIYYSLDSPTARGGQAGIHESVLGLSSAGIPLAGGALVAILGSRVPFQLAALCVGAGLAFSVWRYLRARARVRSGLQAG